MRWKLTSASLPWILLLCCPQGGTFVLTLPICLRRIVGGFSAGGCRPGEGTSFRENIALASWICARGGSTEPSSTMRNGWRSRKVATAGAASADEVSRPSETAYLRERRSPTARGAAAANQSGNGCNSNGNPGEAVTVAVATTKARGNSSRRVGWKNGGDTDRCDTGSALDRDVRDGDGGGNRDRNSLTTATATATAALAKESMHLKLRAMQLGNRRAEEDNGGCVKSKADEMNTAVDGSEGDDDDGPPDEAGAGLPPRTLRLLEYRYRSPGGEIERFASIGGDVSKFSLFLDSAVSRGLLEPPAAWRTPNLATMADTMGAVDGETQLAPGVMPTEGLLPWGDSHGMDNHGEAHVSERASELRSDAEAAAALVAAGTENPTAIAEGRWAAHISVSTVEIADEGVQESLKELWKAERLLSQERDVTDVLRGGEPCFSELLACYTRRTKANHWEVIPRRRLLDVLEEYDPEVSSRYGWDPDRSEEATLSLLRAMLEWFKKEFPYYYDRCQSCGNAKDNTFIGYVYPTNGERTFRASRTEVYHCSSCGETSRFPRYAAVSKVLETRRGRCGEYSVLMLRLLEALRYECRWVVDWSDHVWLEAWIGGRWVHVDPCEAAVDEPLLYESWGKNQTYIMAFTPREVVDVTDKYTSNFDAAKARRDVDPDAVAESIASATKTLQEPES